MRELHSELAIAHQREVTGAFAFDVFLRKHGFRTAADLIVSRKELVTVSRIERSAGWSNLAGNKLFRVSCLEHYRIVESLRDALRVRPLADEYCVRNGDAERFGQSHCLSLVERAQDSLVRRQNHSRPRRVE